MLLNVDCHFQDMSKYGTRWDKERHLTLVLISHHFPQQRQGWHGLPLGEWLLTLVPKLWLTGESYWNDG
jgi:hypothetical protein